VRLFVFGLGYSASRFVHENSGLEASGTVRAAEARDAWRSAGVEAFEFGAQNADLRQALAKCDILLVSIPPLEAGEPALDAFDANIRAAPRLRRILYLSTVGVYGGMEGEWVDEASPTAATTPRAHARLTAEARWFELGRERKIPVDVLRLAGIYGPGRNALVKLKEGGARRIIKAGQLFNRIHVDDISGVLSALIASDLEGGLWNVADLEPAPPQDVTSFAAALLGVAPPPEEPFESADMTPMARSFYSGNQRVCVRKLKERLGYVWRYPTYREGLRKLLAAP
jgi:nucleoside-diphosphate-sugar epimerase